MSQDITEGKTEGGDPIRIDRMRKEVAFLNSRGQVTHTYSLETRGRGKEETLAEEIDISTGWGSTDAEYRINIALSGSGKTTAAVEIEYETWRRIRKAEGNLPTWERDDDESL